MFTKCIFVRQLVRRKVSTRLSLAAVLSNFVFSENEFVAIFSLNSLTGKNQKNANQNGEL